MNTGIPNDVPRRTIERIRALLAKAEATEYPAEAETFREAAYGLLAKWKIDRAALGLDDDADDVLTEEHVEIIAPYATEKALLLDKLVKAMGGEGYLKTAKARSWTGRYRIFAFSGDLAVIKLLYASLVIQSERELAKAKVPPLPPIIEAIHRNNPARLKANRRSWATGFRKTWLRGFADEAVKKLEAATRKESADRAAGPSDDKAALVLNDRRNQVARFYKEQTEGEGVRITNSRARGNGYNAGAEAGRRADVGQSRFGRPVAGSITR